MHPKFGVPVNIEDVNQGICIAKPRRFSIFATILCVVILSSIPTSEAQEPEVKNVVLVHGAWADGSGWRGVYDILVKDGFNVSIVQEPETSFQDDVAATRRILALQSGHFAIDTADRSDSLRRALFWAAITALSTLFNIIKCVF